MFEAPSKASMSASVNAAPEAVLYSADGREVRVPAADREHWLRQGFTTKPFELRAAAEELGTMFAAAHAAVRKFVEVVEKSGTIDPSEEAEYATAVVALREVEKAWGKLERAIHEKYPMQEAQDRREA